MTRAWRGQVELDREELLETEAAIFEATSSVGLPPRPGHQQEAASPLAGKMAMSAETVPEIPPMAGEESERGTTPHAILAGMPPPPPRPTSEDLAGGSPRSPQGGWQG